MTHRAPPQKEKPGGGPGAYEKQQGNHTPSAAPRPIQLPVAGLTLDPEIQQRASTDEALVDEYAETIKGWIAQAPIVVFSDTKTRWVADGFHRVLAARKAGLYAAPAVIHDGGRRDALLYAVGANQTHGLRRSSADKRRAVETLLRDPEWSQWSDRMIAERVGCSPTTVGAVRGQVSKLDTCESPADPEPSPPRPHVVTVTTCEPPVSPPDPAASCGNSAVEGAELSAPRAAQVVTVATCESPAEPTPVKRVGRDGKAYPAPAPKPAPAVAPPPRKEPAPKGPTAADAMRACIRVTGALAELEKLDGVLLPDEPALPPMVKALREALERYERWGGE